MILPPQIKQPYQEAGYFEKGVGHQNESVIVPMTFVGAWAANPA